MLTHIFAGIVGYIIGSFPTAYFLVKWKSNIDIRKAGSGNVGTLNSYEVTNSKSVGLIVLLVDLLKGIATILVARIFFGSDFSVVATAGICAVIGHNFPVWLGFKGGRGLATAAGVMLMLGWVFVPLWMAAWFVGNKISKDVNVGNAVGTLVITAVAVFISESHLERLVHDYARAAEMRIFVVILAFVILIRLVEPVKAYIARGGSAS